MELTNVKKVIISEYRVIIESSDGKRLVIEPDYFDEIVSCVEDPRWFYTCIEENLKLRVVSDG